MHPSVLKFAQQHLTSAHIRDAEILEVGAYNVNGSVRPYVESHGPALYVGVDISAGPGVDIVADCERLPNAVPLKDWDVVICTEMLEHVPNWRACMWELISAVRQGGYLLLTTRSPGFPYHGFPGDYWRFTHQDMRRILDVAELDVIELADDEPDTPGVLVFARKPGDWQAPHVPYWQWLDVAVAAP